MGPASIASGRGVLDEAGRIDVLEKKRASTWSAHYLEEE